VPLLLPEGSQLRNRYQIHKVLDASPLRNIYLVQDLHLRGNTWVAKQILPVGTESINTQGLRRRYEQEARSLGELEHPAFPKLLDYFFKDQCFYLIREYIPGTDLRTLLAFEGGNFSESDALRLTQPIAELLGFLARKKVGPSIFRELSLDSLIITPQGEIKLVDLGFTRLFGKASTLGSVDYASPEQFSGEATDSRTLVYNLGAILYHLITGFNPGDSPFNLEPLDFWAPDTSPATIKIVERALQHKPSNRFASPEEMVKQIKKARAQLQKGKSKARPRGDSDTQPLDGTLPLSAWVAVSLTLLFLGVGSYAVYEVLFKGIGG
jgi:serine/threonine-protein kinase